MYGKTFKQHVGRTILSAIIVAILFCVRPFLTNLGAGKLINLVIGVFLIVLIINCVRWIAVVCVKLIWKASSISYEKALNRDIHFKCTDKITQFLVKVGALYSITEANIDKHNQEEKSKKGFINCLEVRDYGSKDEKEMIFASLGASWDIEDKKGLFETVQQLMDQNNFTTTEFNIEQNQWFEKILKKNHLQFDSIKGKKSSKHIAAFNLQRAVLLLREALTCDLISIEEFDRFKEELYSLINEEFKSMEEFIIDYLIGVCYFYENKVVFGPVSINERANAIRVLIENDYFNKDLNTI